MKDNKYLSQYGKDTPEYEYLSALLNRIRSVTFDLNLENALALFRVIQSEKWNIDGVCSDEHPISSSLTQDAELIGHIFHSVNPGGYLWWRDEYLTSKQEVSEEVYKKWKETITRDFT